MFCSQKRITGTNGEVTAGTVQHIVDDYLNSVKPSGYVEIAFFGGSFTGIPEKERIALLSVGKEYIDKGLVNGIRLSTRPDYISEDILKQLEYYGVTAIELGVQSLDDEVLKKSGRGHTADDVFKAVSLIKNHGFELGLQMMTGLPGDTPEKSFRTAELIASLAPDTVRIYPTLVIKDTALCDMLQNGSYTPWNVDETVSAVIKIKKLFDNHGIRVIRNGLQATEEISPSASVVGGPYHAAFGELVESGIFYEKLSTLLGEAENAEVKVMCNPAEVSKIVGHNKMNKIKLYNEKKIKLKAIPDTACKAGELKIIEVKNHCS